MNTPAFKKALPVLLIIITIPVLLFAIINGKNKKHSAQSSQLLKAVYKSPAMPLPLYGYNGLNTRGPSWTNDAFRDSVAALHFKIIRYPGGTIGDYWDWRKGWFMDESEIKNPQHDPTLLNELRTYNKIPYSPTGLKELKLIVDQTHCEVVFTLNMVTKSLDDQLDMLKTAESLGIPVKWVELGNEYSIDKTIGRYKFPSAREYGRACQEWTQAIKSQFPDASVAVIGGNRKYSQDVQHWNEEVLRYANNSNAIIGHFYPKAFDVVDDDGINFEKLYNSLDALIEEQGFKSLPNNTNAWITEYNIQWAAGKDGPDKTAREKFALTWGQALATILMTSMATDKPNVDPQMVLDHSIANWSAFAAIETDKKTYRKLPNGIGFTSWCDACTGKVNLRQIAFRQSNNGYVRDYEVLGWKFSNGTDNTATSLFVNFTADPVKIDISSLNENGKKIYSVKHTAKNQIINSWRDIDREKRPVENNMIELPPYSIATL